jgi:hypothetical protein
MLELGQSAQKLQFLRPVFDNINEAIAAGYSLTT